MVKCTLASVTLCLSLVAGHALAQKASFLCSPERTAGADVPQTSDRPDPPGLQQLFAPPRPTGQSELASDDRSGRSRPDCPPERQPAEP
jgi:hypothetical protein